MIDRSKLPQAALIDTCVLILALGERPDDPRSQLCKEFFESMVLEKRNLYIAAPTLSEYIRENSDRSPPKTKGIQILSFDKRAATRLGQNFPETTLVQFRNADGTSLNYVKYDAMIVACAVANRIECIVSVDGRPKDSKGEATKLFRLAEHVGLVARTPEYFQERQGDLLMLIKNESP